ncbi:MAG: transglutaminase domain-containing protein [Coriobacteriales bacterium]|jgi:transglutaminase-like putative cysteine protease
MSSARRSTGTIIGSAVAFLVVVAAICVFGWLSVRLSDIPVRHAWLAATEATDQVDFLEANGGKAPYEGRYRYQQLDEEGRRLYEAIYRNLYFMRGDAFIYGADADDALDTYFDLWYDSPEIFYTADNASATESSVETRFGTGHLETLVHFHYLYERDQIPAVAEQLEGEVAAIMAGVGDGWSEEEKAAYFHDVLIERADYSYDSERVATTQPEFFESSTVAGPLLRGEAICGGYTQALELLCRRAGIDCFTVIGRVDEEEDPETMHAWNALNIDGSWTNVDTTWDEALSQAGMPFEYLFVTGAELLESGHHANDNEVLPDACRT